MQALSDDTHFDPRGRCVILDHFDPKIFLEAVQKERITSTFIVPTMIYVLLDYPI